MELFHTYGNTKSKDEAINFLKQSFKNVFIFFDTPEVYVRQTTDGNISNNE